MPEIVLPDRGLILPDSNGYIKHLNKGEDTKFFPNVVNNDRGWNIGFKFGDFHFSVQLAGSPQPVLHDFFVEGGMSHKEATFIIEQLRIAMCKVKHVEGSRGQQFKRTAIKVIAKRIHDESDLS